MIVSDSFENTPEAGPLRRHLAAAGLLFLLTVLAVFIAHLGFAIWIVFIALLVVTLQAMLFAAYFSGDKHKTRFFWLESIPSAMFIGVFIFLTVAKDAPGAGPGRAGSEESGVGQTEVASFEMLHGFGPIKEVVEVGPLDTLLAMQGKPIFESKCGTCHKLDERYTGPPLRHVTRYRSPAFIMNQILDPAQNVANHPHMQELLKMYYTYMPDQNVSTEGARTLVEYLRWESERGESL